MRDMRAIQANDSSSLPRATFHSVQMELVGWGGGGGGSVPLWVEGGGAEGGGARLQWAPQIKKHATKS